MHLFNHFYSFVKNREVLYSREQAKQLKEQFWTSFGQYMSVVPAADLDKVNWVNYKTGIKHLFFSMDATNKAAVIMIEMTHPDDGIRELMYAQFLELSAILHATLGEEWEWDTVYYDALGKKTARISMSLPSVSVFKKDDWSTLISFFKPRMIALDEFWSSAKFKFDIFK